VLCSGGLDSVVLLAMVNAERNGRRVVPIYVSVGLAWERQELATLGKMIASPAFVGVEPVTTLRFEMTDVYPPTHWAVRGEAPAFDTPDQDVYLEGRNLVLLTKAAVFMARTKLSRVSLGSLAGNPFPDATPDFFATLARALSLGLAADIEIATPLSSKHKAEVIKIGDALGVPLEWTMSCMQPSAGQHCGRCSKCRERRDAFTEAGVPDRTDYATRPIR
jgi:7-cyano-7-deazaguanine synthase